MLENKSSRVYCFCAVRSYHRSSRSAPKTRSRQARTITEMGLFCTNRSNTSPSMAASLMAKVKKAYRTQYRHTLTPLVHRLTECRKQVTIGIVAQVRQAPARLWKRSPHAGQAVLPGSAPGKAPLALRSREFPVRYHC